MSITKSKIVFICLTGLFLSMPATVFAGAESGFYIGAGVGDAGVDVNENDFDESDSAYKIFGGYNIGFIPLVDFAVEASYVDFGSPSADG
ncbi:MAG: outer membrane beta-barrel protein, partial [Gammaproteobacteria bacterium]